MRCSVHASQPYAYSDRLYVRTLMSLRNRLAPATDTQGRGRSRESNSKDTRYVCCYNAFKIVLALSLVYRWSSPFTRQDGQVLQHRHPVASLRCLERVPRGLITAAWCPYCALRRINTQEECTGTRGASLDLRLLRGCAMNTGHREYGWE